MCQQCFKTHKINKNWATGHKKAGVFFRLGLFVLLGVVRFYRAYVSPLMAARCRYYPTCSVYALQALTWHGPWRGGALTLKRLLSCQPWGGSGVDFVPVPMGYFFYQPCFSRVSFVGVDKKSYRGFLTHLIKKGVSGVD